MGVTGLWTVVAPTARPTKLETLNRKRLAVDASIWIYQFLKAVRDKDGNALRNSHVVGFFRRICKLLYFGIKPVFVFDGGAPILKRETIRQRARRREGRRDDAARTAGKLLAVQVARAAEEEAKRQKDGREKPDEEVIPEDQELVYVEEIGLDQQQRQAGRVFKKQDQYHLPELNVSMEEMGAPNDPRVMSQAELEAYAKQFHDGEDINLYDFSKIDFDSSFFQSLPAGDKYNILNAARLRSRLRMGYSKEQLDDMFPDRMAFSKFQIERVQERNELTQRLMHISGMNEGEWDMGSRIAGERGSEYILVRNDGVEGGWALGVVSKQGSKKSNAIDLDEEEMLDEPDNSEEDDFEDVEIEGVNRIPQAWKRKRQAARELDHDLSYEEAAERIAKKRKAVYDARKNAAMDEPAVSTRPTNSGAAPGLDTQHDTGMFVEDDANEEEDVFEDVTMTIPLEEDDDDDLQKAIAMSLEQPEDAGGFVMDEDISLQPHTRDDHDDDGFDLQAALVESRKSKYVSKTNVRKPSPLPTKSAFSGPLPFESLNLGQSLLGKKKAKKAEENLSGGFDRGIGDTILPKVQPVPDWFNQAPKLRTEGLDDPDQESAFAEHATYGADDSEKRKILHSRVTKEVIDLDVEEELPPSPDRSSDSGTLPQEEWDPANDQELLERQQAADQRDLEAVEIAEARRKAEDEEREKRYELARQIAAENEETEPMVVDEVQVNPPSLHTTVDNIIERADGSRIQDTADEEVEWSDSDQEKPQKYTKSLSSIGKEPANRSSPNEQADGPVDEDDLFEDVEPHSSPVLFAKEPISPALVEPISTIDPNMFIDDDDDDDDGQASGNQGNEKDAPPQPPEDDIFADDSDEELMRQLANETEEHLRFANELNNTRLNLPTQTAQDYENELKQLRNQQKKDRRDADEVTQTMIHECQALLRLFGLPYITAPMEAEAQCAELVHLGLVDGIVTDDSDIFLFGGTRIYKNMFNAAKFVECYLAGDLEKEYALDRQKLIRFAHLLGSDYTEGIPGIGPVTALEIISDFPDLSEFKEWTTKVQLGAHTPSIMEGLLNTNFRRKFKRTVQRKLFLPTTFPDMRVDTAYLVPEVDSNSEEFQWGVPDLDKLRSFLMATIGWSQERTDEILVPVIRDINQREVEGVQTNITRYFAGNVGAGAAPGRGINGYNVSASSTNPVEGTAPRNRTGKESGRMKNAYSRLRGEAEKKKRTATDAIRSENNPVDVQEPAVAEAVQSLPNDETIRDTVNDGRESQGEADDSPSATPRPRRRAKTKSTAKKAGPKHREA